MIRMLALSALLVVASACNRSRESPRPSRAPAPGFEKPDSATQHMVPAPVAESDAESASTDAAIANVAEDAAEPRVIEGDGVHVEVRDDGSVEVRATDQWDASVRTVFDSCEYARAAIPTLRRSLGEDRAAAVVSACGEHDPDASAPHVAGPGRRGAARPPARPIAR